MRAKPLGLRDGDREELSRWLRSSTIRAGLAQRARIVLLAAEGHSHVDVAAQVGVSVPTVRLWRTRYARGGLAALSDAERSGRPKTVDDRLIVEATLRPPPKKLGVTHWSSRLLAPRLGVAHATVARAWKAYGVHQPWRAETFTFSTDPELVAKVTAPRKRGCPQSSACTWPHRNAVVLCVDVGAPPGPRAGGKSQIQALDRTAPMLPMQPGLPERRTHDYKRNGTTTLGAPPPALTRVAVGESRPWTSRPGT